MTEHSDGQSAGMSEFVVRLGTSLGSRNIARKTLDVSVTRHTFSGLVLREGATYYCCVTAVSDAGLTATACSDGVKVTARTTCCLYYDRFMFTVPHTVQQLLSCFVAVLRKYLSRLCAWYDIGIAVHAYVSFWIEENMNRCISKHVVQT